MSQIVEISDDAYAILKEEAKASGVTPAEWLERALRERNGNHQGKPEQAAGKGETMYDRLKDKIGKFRFGDSSCLSENTGAKFADYLEQKRKEGHL